jgi:hypothetical protein
MIRCLQEVEQLTSFCGEQLAAAAAIPMPTLPSPRIPPTSTAALDVHGTTPSTTAISPPTESADQRVRALTRSNNTTIDEASPTLPPLDGQSSAVRLPRTLSSTSDLSAAATTTGATSPHMPSGRLARPANPTPDDQPDVRSPPQAARPLGGVNAFTSVADPTTGKKRQTVFIPADVDVLVEGAAASTTTPTIVDASGTPRSPSLVGVKVDEIDDENMLEQIKASITHKKILFI